MKIQFQGQELTCVKREYDNKRPALQLVDSDGMPYCTASVNLPNAVMHPCEMAIKDYSENAGLLQVLIDAGVVSEPVGYVRSGFVEIPVCDLLMD
jgi:hypothetical protein